MDPRRCRQLRLHRPRRTGARADDREAAHPQPAADPDPLPGRLRLGRQAGRRAEHHPADPDRRDPDRADERPPAGPARQRPRRDRLMAERLLDLQSSRRASAGWRASTTSTCTSTSGRSSA